MMPSQRSRWKVLVTRHICSSASAAEGQNEPRRENDGYQEKWFTAIRQGTGRLFINEAYERLLKSDVKYRFSIDMASLKAE
jgi:hypothetical protein